MRCSLDTWFSGFTAFGTVTVAVLAIWGNWIRSRIGGPKLTISLRDTGLLTPQAGGTNAIFYHVEVNNERKWSPARKVQVKIIGIARRRPDGSYYDEYVLPLQLTWIYPELQPEQARNIVGPTFCDLGYLAENVSQFRLRTYGGMPTSFPGWITGGQAMRVTLIASGENGESRRIAVEISWDGIWVADVHEIMKHLVVKEV